MRIIVLDDWENYAREHEAIHKLKKHFDVKVYNDKPTTDELIERLKRADVVIPIRERTKFTKEVLQQARHLKLISQTGSGLAHIDMAEAENLGIPIATTPGGSKAVVELIFGFMLAYSRKLIELDQKMKEGHWTESIGLGLENKTIGIIGLGKIGSGVAKVAKAFNMRVVSWGPRLSEERAQAEEVEYVTLTDLLKQSHYITVNVRLVPETRNLLKDEHFNLMRHDAFLINTSRGEVIEEEALVRALREKRIGGAGLDVFSHEPLDSHDELRTLKNVILSPHIGWKTDKMFNQFLSTAAENILARFSVKESDTSS